MDFQGHEVASIAEVVRALVVLCKSETGQEYLGFGYGELARRIVVHIQSLDEREYDAQITTVCAVCREYLDKAERDEAAGEKARIVLEEILSPAIRSSTDTETLRTAFDIYSRLNRTCWYIADDFAQFLVGFAGRLASSGIVGQQYIQTLVEDWASSNDERKRLHSVSVIEAWYPHVASKSTMEAVLDILAEGDKTQPSARRLLKIFGISRRREFRRRVVRAVEIVAIVLGIGAAIVAIVEFLR